MKPNRKVIPLLNLALDPQNPRLDDGVSDSLEALHGVMIEQKEQLVTLIRSIAEDGLDPSLSLIVTTDGEDRYLVLEGNRRVTALKLLQNPELANGVLSTGLKREIKKAAEKMAFPIEEVPCVVFQDRESADPWLERRHSGPLEGAGLVSWGAREKARFARRRGDHDPTLEVYEFVREHGALSDEDLEAMRDMAFTNVQRMIEDSKVRPLLGIEIVNGRVHTSLGRDEVIKGLRRLVLDTLGGKFNSRTMNKWEKRVEHVEKYAPDDVPSEGAVTGELVLLADAPATRGAPETKGETDGGQSGGTGGADASGTSSGGGSDSSGGGSGGGGSGNDTAGGGGGSGGTDHDAQKDAEEEEEPAPSNAKRSEMFPKTPKLYVPDPARLNKVHEELSKLNITKFPNAAAVLFRVFFELSVDTYCEEQKLPTTRKHNGHEKHLTLVEKFKAVCQHIEHNGGKSAVNALKPVRLLMESSEVLLGGIEHMHQFVHGPHMVPTTEVLRATADQALPFLRAIWPQPKK